MPAYARLGQFTRAGPSLQKEADAVGRQEPLGQREQARQRRKFRAETGYATAAALAWRRAEQAFHQWESDEETFEQIRVALQPLTREGGVEQPPARRAECR